MTTMINEPIRLSAGELSFTFLNSGDLYSGYIRYNDVKPVAQQPD